MSFEPGPAMLRDVLGGERSDNAGQFSSYTRQQLDTILARAGEGVERPPVSDDLLDRVIAPIMYHVLFTDRPPDHEYAQGVLDRALKAGSP